MTKHLTLAALLAASAAVCLPGRAATVTWTQDGEANVADWDVQLCWDARPCSSSTVASKSVTVPTPWGQSLVVQIQATPADPESYAVSEHATATLARTTPEAPTGLRLVGSSVTATDLAASSTVTLSTEGSLDWVHWGLASVSDVNRKSGASVTIGALTPIGAATVRVATPSTWPVMAWTGGTPTASEAGTHGAVTFDFANAAAGTGWSITAPASTTTRTLHLYLYAYQATGTVTASIDGSTRTLDLGETTGSGYYDVAIPYSGSGALAVTWLKTSAATNGRIGVLGAALE